MPKPFSDSKEMLNQLIDEYVTKTQLHTLHITEQDIQIRRLRAFRVDVDDKILRERDPTFHTRNRSVPEEW